MRSKLIGFIAGLMVLGVVLPLPATAQSIGIVSSDRAIIWRIDISVVAAIVDAGVELELVGRSERWFEVLVPTRLGGRGETGLISVTQIRLAPGSSLPPVRALRGSLPGDPATEGADSQTAARPPSLPPGPAVGVRAFGQAGVIGFSARESFEAVTGSSLGASYGGGAQVRFRSGLFVQVSLEQYRRTGQRVFVFEGESFPLGIASTITIRPFVAGLGFRPPTAGRVLPYAGAGIGRYWLRETSLFEDSTERVDETHIGYHAHMGVEFRVHRWVAPAAEVRYTRVPDSLGRGGASAQFDESELGGWHITGKVLIGR
jgi:hypothetical protein